MSFELAMLLGFFGTVLFSLLPESPAATAVEDDHGEHCRRDTGDKRVKLTGRAAHHGKVSRRRPGRAAA
ncbi:MAG: hypothetical protein FDZ69_02415 [Deltaproteobacteria bacterium]|nr:MAG: hypothetical protein FDZ69_02415 [Deltaproteobacteria bacterium]